ncbi:MAG: hypothetical protein RJA07_2240 [Bacteroidota bacterium]|jgi:hypothetical protein
MKNIFLIVAFFLLTLFSCTKDKRKEYIQGTWTLSQFLVDGIDSTERQKSEKLYTDYSIFYTLAQGKTSSQSSGFRLYATARTNLSYIQQITLEPNYDEIRLYILNFNLMNDSSNISWSINKLTNNEWNIETTYKGKNYKSFYIKKQ